MNSAESPKESMSPRTKKRIRTRKVQQNKESRAIRYRLELIEKFRGRGLRAASGVQERSSGPLGEGGWRIVNLLRAHEPLVAPTAILALTETESTANVDLPPYARFRKLTDKWRRDTEFTSSISDIVIHPAYQQIIGMGRSALPFIFKELRERGGHWFWALRAITGVDPVPEEHQGYVALMAKDWLEWAAREGYL